MRTQLPWLGGHETRCIQTADINTIPMGRYVFINEDATRDAVLRASRIAAAYGAKVVEVHSMAFLVDAGAETASVVADALAGWKFTTDRRRAQERRVNPARRVGASTAVA